LKYKAALIGCGRIGSLLSEDKLREKPCTHAEAYYKNPNIELIAGCDKNKDRLKEFSKKWKVNKIYTDYNELLNAEKYDIISVAVGVEANLEVIEACINADTKIILCEKPLALDIKEAERIVKLARSEGVLLIVNHSRRFFSDFVKVRDLIRSGVIGRLKTVFCVLAKSGPSPNDNYLTSGGGMLFHDGTHLVDTLRFLLDEKDPLDINAQFKKPSTNIKVEQNIQCMMNYSDDLHIFFDCSDRDYFHFELDLQGDKGRIIIGNGVHRYFIKTESPYYEGFNSLIEKSFPDYSLTPFFVNITESMVKFLKTGELPESTGEQALNTLKVIMAIYKSAATGKKLSYPVKISGHPFEKVFE